MTSEIKPEDVKLPEPAIKMTPAGMRDFIGANFDSLEYGREDQQPDEGDRFLLSSHDLLSAFSWWDYPVFTADQVRAAVLEATMAERERCAKACDDRSKNVQTANTYRGRVNQAALFVADQLELCASVIRAGHSVTETKRD